MYKPLPRFDRSAHDGLDAWWWSSAVHICQWCFLQWQVIWTRIWHELTLVTRYGPYQSSVTILGFYLPSAIVICLLIGQILKNIWSQCFIFLWLKSQRGIDLCHIHFSGLSIRRCVACSGSGCVSSYCKVTCHLCHLVTFSPVTWSPFSPGHLFSSPENHWLAAQVLTLSLITWSAGHVVNWLLIFCQESVMPFFLWAVTAFLHHPILIGSLQEEMVLAFLFLPYLAGYLLLHLNIQVKIQTPLYKFNVELMLLFLPYPLDIMQLHISR